MPVRSGGGGRRFVPSAPAATELAFPRLGGMLIGSPQNYSNTTYRAQIAKLDMAILGMYNGWNSGGAATSVNAIKALNPDILLGNYTVVTEADSTRDSTNGTRWDKLTNEVGPSGVGNWWAYDSTGTHTDWSGGAFGGWDTNLTSFVTADSNGDKYPQFCAKLDYTQIIQGVDWDIWYCDNNFWKPRSDADWNRSGSNDSQDDLTVRGWWRDGQRAHYDQIKALAPSLEVMVNADSDLDGSVWPPEADDFTQYRDVVHGGFMEHAIGKSWSVEEWSGWDDMMAWYRSLSGNLLDPGRVLFDQFLVSTTDYKAMRYGFASCLMDDGYYSASTDYNAITWFDEFDLAGTSTTKWLGVPVDGPQTTPWQSGVYRRRFTNGVVLCNPKGNGSQTVTLPAGYSRFSGSQAPAVNSGATVSGTVTLADRDGLFLVGSGGVDPDSISPVGTLVYSSGTTSNTTLSVTPAAVGHLLVLCTAINASGTTVTGVAGGGVTTWTQVGGPYVSPTHGRNHAIWIGKVTTAGAATITLTTSVSVAGVRVDRGVQEFSSSLGSSVTWAADGSAGTATATAATTIAFATLTPSGSPRLCFGYAVTGGFTSAVSGGYTRQADANDNPWIYNTSVTAATSPTVTQTSGDYSALSVLIQAS